MLGSRDILYGEWMYAKHTVCCGLLPHYFLEFDILDRETGRFLDTPTRHGDVRGVRVEEIEDPLTREVRCLDKLIDGLAKPVEKIL